MPDPFISTQDLADFLGRDISADPAAIAAVDAACDICRDVAEQDFNAGTATVRLDGTGSDALILPQRPVRNAGTVTVNGAAETSYVFTTEGLLFRGTAGGGVRQVWPQGRQNVVVTYESGFATGDLPRSVRMVALQIASRLVVQGVAKAETIGDVSVSYAISADDLTVNELRILRRYKAARSY